MTIILRSKSTLTAPAPYLVPPLAGHRALSRYAAMTVGGADGTVLASVPDANGGPAAAVLDAANSKVTRGSVAGVRTIDSKGVYETGRLIMGTTATHPATSPWTVIMALAGHTGAGPSMEIGDTRLTLSGATSVVFRPGAGTTVTVPNGPVFLALVLDGDAGSLSVNGGEELPLNPRASTSGGHTPYFGRSGGGTTRWIDIAVIPGVVPAGDIAAIRAAWRAYYPILP
ncbi:hypothetical protein [Micrococcus lylae]|uniref:hypothetical protein n=1 Tax=Micrococcus lylae TaxID=1273 RepID=UPI000C80C3ED|nr:hypothetical protein [Micrococcus lylae]WIK82176.1 hypothetical protein CJ228_011410 [Micrococcus lylae]